jgi:tight adherence protein B
MTPLALSRLVSIAALALGAAVFLIWYAARLRAAAVLRRRLGALRAVDDAVLRDEAGPIAALLVESGLGWTPAMFAVRASAAALFGALAGLALGSIGLALCLAIAGAGAVWLAVRRARVRRLAHCDEQMPQALEIMSLALRAGHALPSALRLAADEAPAPLCHELRRAADEHALGRPVGAVIAGLARRLPGCPSVATFSVAVAVLEETGGNLVAVLERIVDTARARVAYHARLRALTAEGRQSARLLAFLPAAFGLAAMITDPSYGRTLLGSSGGRVVLALAAALWAAGLIWIRRLVRPVS